RLMGAPDDARHTKVVYLIGRDDRRPTTERTRR
ncbi:MAG: hypothetical protein QOD76_862, partial [Solirubrobacteraceae bacterium]|nr:hypothetical protein [Solirubrobacteraceae bacterium]